MPSGNYDGPHSSANISGDPDVFHDDDLAASIKMAIQEYKEAENGGSFLHTDGWATYDFNDSMDRPPIRCDSPNTRR